MGSVVKKTVATALSSVPCGWVRLGTLLLRPGFGGPHHVGESVARSRTKSPEVVSHHGRVAPAHFPAVLLAVIPVLVQNRDLPVALLAIGHHRVAAVLGGEGITGERRFIRL